MKVAKFHYAFLFLAGFLFSLHSLVPHVHGSTVDDSGGLTAENIYSSSHGLQSLLHDFFTGTDLGEDHLEHFSLDRDLTLDKEYVSLSSPRPFLVIELTSPVSTSILRLKRVFQNRYFLIKSIYPDVDSSRGPPTLA